MLAGGLAAGLTHCRYRLPPPLLPPPPRRRCPLVRAGNACVEAQCCKDWAHRFEIAARVRGEHGKFKLGAEHDAALAAGFRECGPGVVGTAELAGLNEQWVSHAKSKCGQRIQ